VVGFTAGNDMSVRDIEGENLLYLSQAKIYDRLYAL
jgi:2-dehydro-3-deoxy-D-arabinonate dehydratase